MDFMGDAMVGKRKFRTFNAWMTVHERHWPLCETSLSFKRIIKILDRIIDLGGKPITIRVGNGPEFTPKDLKIWPKDRNITIQYIQAGKPMQNSYIERFNDKYREAIVDSYLIFDLYQIKQLTLDWIER